MPNTSIHPQESAQWRSRDAPGRIVQAMRTEGYGKVGSWRARASSVASSQLHETWTAAPPELQANARLVEDAPPGRIELSEDSGVDIDGDSTAISMGDIEVAQR